MIAARRVLGTMAVAGAPATPSGPTVYLQTDFLGSGSIDGVTPETGPVASVLAGGLTQSGGLLIEGSSTRGNLVAWDIGQTDYIVEARWRNDTGTGRQIAVLAHCNGTASELWRALYSYALSPTLRHVIYERSGGSEPARASSALALADATFYRWRVTVSVSGGVGAMTSEIYSDDGTTLLDTLTYAAFSTNLAAGRVGLQIVTDTSFDGGDMAFDDIEAASS